MSAHAALRTVAEMAPMFPPSFDNDPWLFGASLFGRAVVLSVSVATIVRLMSRNKLEHVGINNPVFYHRAAVICFCLALVLGSGGDTLTFLMWGELETRSLAIVMTIAKAMDALTVYPFIAGLFVPSWMRWVRWSGLIPVKEGLALSGRMQDLRTTWTTGAVPFRLVAICAATSALVSASKYAWWASHGVR